MTVNGATEVKPNCFACCKQCNPTHNKDDARDIHSTPCVQCYDNEVDNTDH